jgi:Holliday junction DNA helicase RuvA
LGVVNLSDIIKDMIHSLSGTLSEKRTDSAVITISGVGLRCYMNSGTTSRLPALGEKITVFCTLRIRDEEVELYGFLDEPTRKFFDLLCTVSGIGPKSALAILDVDSIQNITDAIVERRADLLSRAPGVGKKTAERIVVDLQNKLELKHSAEIAGTMGVAAELEEVLVGLGYSKIESRNAVAEAQKENDFSQVGFETQLREALRVLGGKGGGGVAQ